MDYFLVTSIEMTKKGKESRYSCHMKINHIKFIASHTSVGQCPTADKPEYAFIGRSNVGKSSLINYLSDRKSIAKISRTPGKTQMINYFEVDDKWHIVDLPGYGYAKVSKKDRRRWDLMVKNYLVHRSQLQNSFLLVDINIDPQPIDVDMINWLGSQNIPFSIIFTKSDKMTKGPLNQKVDAYKQFLLQYWNELPPIFVSSSSGKAGRDELLNYIKEINHAYFQNLKK